MQLLTITHGRRVLLTGLLCVGLAALAVPLGRLGLTLPLLLIAPGYLAERSLPTARLPLLLRFTLWMSLSMSLVALLYLWLTVLGLALSTPLLWILATMLALAGLAAAWQDLGRDAGRSGQHPGPRLVPALLVIIFVITLWARMAQVEDLALPAWVDSVHHALMVRVAAETGMAPFSLRPYLPVDDLPYHWGYHVFTATLMRLSGLALPDALIIPGQILNALCGIAVAGLAHYFWRRPSAAVGAAIAVGLISFMPAYYVSWGRYTQLSGMLMLPGLAIAWGEALHTSGRGRWILVVMLIAGLSLVHFRVLLFALALLAAQLLVWAAPQSFVTLRVRFLSALAAAVAVALLTAPWLWLLARRALLPALASEGGLAGGGSYNALTANLLWSRQNLPLIVVALLGAWLGIRRRARAAAVILIWVALLAIESNPWLIVYLTPGMGVLLLIWGLRQQRLSIIIIGVGLILINPRTVELPYLWLITNDVVVISLFMPLGVLTGGGIALLYAALPPTQRWPRAVGASAAAFALGVAGWGAYDQRGVLNQNTVLATSADRDAITWAATNTPPDAHFLVNSTSWLGTVGRGADGGWWLLPLAGRSTTAPPVLFIYADADYAHHVFEVEQTITTYHPGQDQNIFDLITREKITYIYLGAKGGVLKPELFDGRPEFHIVYQQAGVTIIAVGAAS